MHEVTERAGESSAANDSLRESEQSRREIFEGSRDAIIVQEAEGGRVLEVPPTQDHQPNGGEYAGQGIMDRRQGIKRCQVHWQNGFPNVFGVSEESISDAVSLVVPSSHVPRYQGLTAVEEETRMTRCSGEGDAGCLERGERLGRG